MPNQEIATVKEDVIVVKAEVGNLKGWIKRIEQRVEGHTNIFHGVGPAPGILSKVNTHEGKLDDIAALEKRIDGLEQWKWVTIGGVWGITILLQIFGPKIVGALEALIK